ncbi:hypothetical protein LXL04_032503 [Taraxacum kok-saghyz]
MHEKINLPTKPGIGAPFLYLWCMAGVTNFQLMRKFDEVNKRMDGQDETLKSIQSSLVELTSAMKTLVSTQDKEVGYVPDVIIMEESDNGNKMSKFTPNPKPDLDIHLQAESSFPPVSNAASGVEKLKQMLSSCEKTDCSKSEQGRGSDSEVRNQIGDMKEDKRGRRSEDTVTEPPVDHSHQKEYMCLFGKLQALKAQIQIQQKSRAKRGEEIYTGLSEMRASLQSHPIIKC